MHKEYRRERQIGIRDRPPVAVKVILQLLLDTNIDQRLVTRAAFEAATIIRT